MGMVPEWFAGKYIADVQLHQRHACAFDGIVQRYAGVGVSACIQHHACQLAGGVQAPGIVQGIHQGAFVVALAKVQRPAVAGARLFAQFSDIVQCSRTVNARLACAQQVEVGAVEDTNGQAGRRRRLR